MHEIEARKVWLGWIRHDRYYCKSDLYQRFETEKREIRSMSHWHYEEGESIGNSMGMGQKTIMWNSENLEETQGNGMIGKRYQWKGAESISTWVWVGSIKWKLTKEENYDATSNWKQDLKRFSWNRDWWRRTGIFFFFVFWKSNKEQGEYESEAAWVEARTGFTQPDASSIDSAELVTNSVS